MKTKRNGKCKIPHSVLERQILCFSSHKNLKLKLKNRDEVGLAREKRGHFCTVYFVQRKFF